MDQWDEALKKLELEQYGPAPKDPIPKSAYPQAELLELDEIFFSETMLYSISIEAVELIAYKINLEKSAGKENGAYILGPRLGGIVANNPIAICSAITSKTEMAIGVCKENGRIILTFSK